MSDDSEPHPDAHPTGEATAPVNDVADPHDAEEEHPYDGEVTRKRHSVADDIGPNSHVHDGSPQRLPPRAVKLRKGYAGP